MRKLQILVAHIFMGVVLAVGVSAAESQEDDRFSHLQLPTMLADASVDLQSSEADTSNAPDNSDVCARYQADIDADLGDVMRAGCEPTLAQMSALMDNPIGNVAMMFNQVDAYRMEEPESGTNENQYNYMMLFQFPKKLNENWNLINRVVLNFPSVPLEQDDIDDFVPPPIFGGDFDYGTGPGNSPSPPPNAPLPVELFDGRTTGFGDMYYIGLFAPNDPIRLDNGAKLLTISSAVT